MAGPAPDSKLWTARENHQGDTGIKLIVGGQVAVTNTGQEPRLSEVAGRDPKSLNLELTLAETGQDAVDVACWKAANFSRSVTEDEFNQVVIRWGAEAIGRTPVINDAEHGALMDKQSNVQNRAAGAKGGLKTAAKKVVKTAKKAAADVKSLVKKVAKTVTGAAKAKPAKKAAKAAAKKAAKPAKKTARKVAKAAKKAVKKARPAPKKAKKGAAKKRR